MKKIFIVLTAVLIAASSCCKAPKVESSVPYKVKDGTIVFKEQPRAAGQKSALKMTCDPIDTVRVGIVGCGSRGHCPLDMRFIPTARIVAFCDLYQDHVDKYQKTWAEWGFAPVKEYVGAEAYKELCESDDVDLIYITTGWKLHTPIALYAMEHGKHVAIEVPAATSLQECWDLVNTCERTRKHCMMLENCVYDKEELIINNLINQGAFGEVYYGAGAYIHNLDVCWNQYTDNWRLEFNQERRGDNYPTHGLGPICRDMNIHRGDKMNTLVAMDSNPFRSAEWGKKKMNVDEFADGDQTVTLIRTEKGHLIEVQHNVYGITPYSRIHEVMGTKGSARKYPVFSLALEAENLPDKPVYKGAAGHGGYEESEEFSEADFKAAIREDFNHPIYSEVEELAQKVGGHGGMDFVMLSRLIYCLNNGLPLDMDVYDAAEWSCVTELSEVSLNAGSMPVQVPDFTRGDWNKYDKIVFEYKK